MDGHWCLVGHVAHLGDVNHEIADSDVSSRGGHLGGQPIAGLEHVQVDINMPRQRVGAMTTVIFGL